MTGRLMLRIVAVPAGEAPLWVREKWVGLSLPLAQRSASPRLVLGSGVLTGPQGLFATLWALVRGRLEPRAGYLVEVEVAVVALAVSSPEAAAWWRENTPHLLRPKRKFMFPRESAEVYEA